MGIKLTEWVLYDDVLAARSDDGALFHLSAEEIFRTVFKGRPPEKLLGAGQPSSSLPGLAFSRYPLDLFIRIEPSPKPSTSSLICRVYGRRNDLLVPINNPFSRSSDHVVFENTWYPFARGSIEHIREVSSEAGLTDPGLTSLRQYLNLITRKGTSPVIEDAAGHAASASQIGITPSGATDSGFIGQMYPYQTDGFRWLSLIAKEGLGCILADQMGLGKTIQIIALLSAEPRANGGTSLVVAPATLLENWRREILRFSPGLLTLVHQGASRSGFASHLKSFDVVITTYDTVVRDLSIYQMVNWNVLVLDEAQAIKTPEAKRTKAIKKLKRRVAIAVTGTPVENRLADLWSLMDFALPGFLGTLTDFVRAFGDDEDGASRLEPLVSPVMLRRKVADVAKDLPERIDIPQPITLDEESVLSYERIRKDTVDEYGQMAALVSLGKLRMFCAHPFLSGIRRSGDAAAGSPKYERLLEILGELIQNSEKALIFTSYTEMADLFVSDLPRRFGGVHIDFIDGRVEVKERQAKVDAFTSAETAGILILNPRAAGTGLNITAANHVIHYNLEWNPALEDQASARAYRRGQMKPVTVHRLFYANTVEEAINDRLERKRLLANSAVVGVAGESADYEDIIKALGMTPYIGRQEDGGQTCYYEGTQR